MLKAICDSLPRPANIVIEIEPRMPTLRTLKVPLDMTLRNLIHNAIKHHDRTDGKIVISHQDSVDFVQFCIRDDGPGIPAEFHQRIFKLFETLRPRDDIEGSGMGLSIVNKTVETVDGKIWLESQPGEDAAFFFLWPKDVSLEGQL